MNVAYRHECSARYARNAVHDSGPGKPTRKRSKCCGADYYVHAGLYGVFVHSNWSGSATYRASEAVSLHRTERAADKALGNDGRLVVRFVSVD